MPPAMLGRGPVCALQQFIAPIGLGGFPLAMRRGSQLPATVKYHGEHSIPPEPVLKVLSDPRYAAAPRHRSARVVLVVAAPPDARLVATLGGAVEPLVHAPDSVHPARIGGIGVVDDAVLERERAHARPIAMVRSRVGSAHGRELGLRPLATTLLTRAPLKHRLAPVVVFDAYLALPLLGERDTKVVVEVTVE